MQLEADEGSELPLISFDVTQPGLAAVKVDVNICILYIIVSYDICVSTLLLKLFIVLYFFILCILVAVVQSHCGVCALLLLQ